MSPSPARPRAANQPFPGPSTVDGEEIAKFGALAAEWWDADGPMAPLHALNPARLSFIKAALCAHLKRNPEERQPLKGLSVLDIGCGAGLVAEPLARLGARVTGADASPDVIAAARAHAEGAGLAIDYRAAPAEALLAQGLRFDAVLALEIVEHVADVAAFVKTLAGLLTPEGTLVMSTPNRTVKGFLATILGAEYIMRWLPRGTHDWRRFLRPGELGAYLHAEGLAVKKIAGLRYRPLRQDFVLDPKDLGVNYMVAATR